MKLNKIVDSSKKKGIIYVDMDGVIVDFVKGIKANLFPEYDEHRYHTEPTYRTEMWDKVGEYSKSGGKMWLELPVMADAMELWEFIKPYNPQILSATGHRAYGAGSQKREWIKTHIDPKVKINLVQAARLKAGFVKDPGDILIDDQPKAIDPWKANGGIGILHTSAKDTITKLKKLGY